MGILRKTPNTAAESGIPGAPAASGRVFKLTEEGKDNASQAVCPDCR